MSLSAIKISFLVILLMFVQLWALSDQEILEKLATISPVVSSFYYGNKGDFDDPSLVDVWSEPFLLVYPILSLTPSLGGERFQTRTL
jgi:hypothetical protein